MATDPKAVIEELLRMALREKAPQSADMPIVIERPKQAGHGDFSSNVALQAAKSEKRKPRDLAIELQASVAAHVSASATLSEVIEKPEVAGPGFINFKLKAGTKTAVIRRILEQGAAFGRTREGRGEKVQVEFVSANPTGPLHVGHGRQAALGDAIAALLESQGRGMPSPASSITTTPERRSRTSRFRCRLAAAGWPLARRAGRRTDITGSTSRTSRATSSRKKATSAIWKRFAGLR
jgi:hypothetical protein